mmetsp:Transcript_16700/g.23551  ORF Transcript_16700/g.23551 Transcript_16700/m.23551 type:complete len:520 (+) Transcript_16700:75-1634(+)
MIRTQKNTTAKMHDSSGCAPPENDHHQHDDEEEKYIYRTAHKLASKIEQEMESYSQIVDPVREQALSKFDRDEITLGRLLGSGGFNDVYALNQISLSSKFHRQCSEDQQRKRKVMARKSKGGKNYAIKLLRSSSCLGSNEGYCNGAADLVVETKILANIEPHRNIIQLHGVSAAGIAGFAKRVEGGYFIIIDQLHDTLDKRIETWRANKTNFTERLLVALELSSALKHLHSYNIIFRDLKPDNIGFDSEGTLKLFDFGLAKELDPREHNQVDDTYEMSGETGSRRYMSPEVVLSQPYNLAADVYSFALVFWQMCSLQEPFAYLDTDEHLNTIILGNERPVINPGWPAKISNIMKWSWTRDASIRPSMKEVFKALRRQIKSELQQEHELEQQVWPSSVRSTASRTKETSMQRVESMFQLKQIPTTTQDDINNHVISQQKSGNVYDTIRRKSLISQKRASLSNLYTRTSSNGEKSFSLKPMTYFESSKIEDSTRLIPPEKKRFLADMLSNALMISDSGTNM